MRKDLIIILLFTVIGAAIYWNSLGNSFHYDDELIVVYNRNIQTLKNLPYFFTSPGMLSADPHIVGHYRPLVVTSYAINYALGGLDTWGYHLVNLFLHIGTALLVYFAIKGMTDSNFAALASGLIFLVHPFNSETVNYITARSSSMSGFFYLLSFYGWMNFREAKSTLYYLFSLLAFIAGMMSKEVVITLPFVLWLYDLYFYRPSSMPEGRSRWSGFLLDWKNYLSYLPFLLIVIIPYFVIRFVTLNRVLDPFQRDLWTQGLTQIPVLSKHWKMFFIPSPLTPFHVVKIEKTFFTVAVISSVIFLSVYITIALLLSKVRSQTSKVASFFMFWFFVVLLPTTIIPLNAIFQENRGYLAIVSFAVLVGLIIHAIHVRSKWAGIGVLVLLIIVYSGATFQRNKVWKDEVSLWSDAARKFPRSPEILTALGIAYRRAGMEDRAIEASSRALEIGGHNNFFAHENLARVYASRGKLDLAIKEFKMAIEVYPYKADTHNELGSLYYKIEKFEYAEKEYLNAIDLDPVYYKSYFNLGVLYTRLGRVDEAIEKFQKALSLNPGHLRTNLNLGILLDGLGRKEEAEWYYKNVLRYGGKEDKMLVDEARARLTKKREPIP